MMRILGKEGMQAVYEDKNVGFTSPEVRKPFQLYKEFAALQPLQKGYLSNTTPNQPAHSTMGRQLFA